MFTDKPGTDPEPSQVNQINIASLFLHVKSDYRIKPKELPKVHNYVYFLSYLKTKISASEAHILSLFPASFQRFSLKFGENVA